jgi:hypothetical protein
MSQVMHQTEFNKFEYIYGSFLIVGAKFSACACPWEVESKLTILGTILVLIIINEWLHRVLGFVHEKGTDGGLWRNQIRTGQHWITVPSPFPSSTIKVDVPLRAGKKLNYLKIWKTFVTNRTKRNFFKVRFPKSKSVLCICTDIRINFTNLIIYACISKKIIIFARFSKRI